MATKALDHLLARLDDVRRRVGEVDPAQVEELLAEIGRQRFPNAPSLARFHDALLFLRAHPPNQSVLRRVESALGSFAKRIEEFRQTGGRSEERRVGKEGRQSE